MMRRAVSKMMPLISVAGVRMFLGFFPVLSIMSHFVGVRSTGFRMGATVMTTITARRHPRAEANRPIPPSTPSGSRRVDAHRSPTHGLPCLGRERQQISAKASAVSAATQQEECVAVMKSTSMAWRRLCRMPAGMLPAMARAAITDSFALETMDAGMEYSDNDAPSRFAYTAVSVDPMTATPRVPLFP